ncbi:MAG: ligand-binding sensor domain-containing protein, partial [Arenimonas sp.]
MRDGANAVRCWLALLVVAPMCASAIDATPIPAAPIPSAPVATTAAAHAASPGYAPSLTGFRRIATAQGLSQTSVRAMVQDRHGFVWVGTQDGLNRFDGNEFRVYRHGAGAAPSLPGDLIRALAIDRQGVLWVGGTGGLSRYREAQDRFEPVPVADARGAQAEVHALHVDRTGALWVATYEGLSRVDPETHARTPWPLPAGEGTD